MWRCWLQPALLNRAERPLAEVAARLAVEDVRLQPPPMLLTVHGWADGAEVPIKYSCSGQPAGVSPAMDWKQVPAGTQSFLVLVHDPEPHPGKGLTDITHWLILEHSRDGDRTARSCTRGRDAARRFRIR